MARALDVAIESAIVNTNDLDRKELIEIHKILH